MALLQEGVRDDQQRWDGEDESDERRVDLGPGGRNRDGLGHGHQQTCATPGRTSRRTTTRVRHGSDQNVKRQYLKVSLAMLTVAMVIPSGFAAAQLGRRADERGGDSYGRSPADVARLRAMDIAGVRLGMTPDQARIALRIAGCQPVRFANDTADVGTDQDYSSRVEGLRRRRLDQPVGAPGRQIVIAERWSKGDERVEVNYVAPRESVT
jgi:hypothetical protein